MKRIDLLQRIANEEYIPEKIIVDGVILYYDSDLMNYYDNNGMHPLFDGNTTLYLNNEIEEVGEYRIKPKSTKYKNMERFSWAREVDKFSNCIIDYENEKLYDLEEIEDVIEIVNILNKLNKEK